MRFGSCCSGIEAASQAWNPIGWEAAWFSEIEPFPCAVLAHHYPDTPNFGDMTKFESWPNDEKHSIDLLCGGTPCQSFSVAGLRKGLDDPRGDLMLTFCAIAAKYRPRWLVWENVPGVLSSNGGDDFRSFLDMIEELGYVCDIEILDAQFFGVAQRRRRVFACGQHREDLLLTKTDTSALTIVQALQEILLCILDEASVQFVNVPRNSDSAWRSKDGATRRMRLFGLLGGKDCYPILLNNLVAAYQRFQQEPKNSVVSLGEKEKALMRDDQLMVSKMGSPFTLTEQSLKKSLGEALPVMRLFTTSTDASQITQHQIYTCSVAALLIAKLTLRLNQSSPSFWSAASSSLTILKEFTSYARSTSSDIFGDMERIQAWSDFIAEAEYTSTSIGRIGIECFGEVFPVTDCMQGHPAPRRKTGEGVAPTIRAGAANGGAGHGERSGDSKDELIIPVAASGKPTIGTLMENASTNSGSAAGNAPCVTYGLAGNTIGRQPENGGNGAGYSEEVGYTLTKTDVHAIVALTITASNDPFRSPQSSEVTNQIGAVYSSSMQVRRLTPTECERLQGFPDSYANVPRRGKPASDGPRYKALGNSWAVPVAAWVGKRIMEVEGIKA